MAGLEHIYHKDTGTLTYILYCKETKEAAIIDPVLDVDVRHGLVTTECADALLKKVADMGVKITMLIETHCHADHASCAPYLQEKLKMPDGTKPPICIGQNILTIISYWTKVFNQAHDTPQDGSQFDRLFKDGEEFAIGKLKVKVMFTPGHTPACVSYILAEQKMVFVGDTIFNPAMGNARCDFPGGSAKTLFESARRILTLPEDFTLFVGHDYPDEGEPCLGVSVKEHKAKNCTLNDRVTSDEFVAANSDKLPVPRLILPSLQANIRAGSFGKPESNGKQYIKLPINAAEELGR